MKQQKLFFLSGIFGILFFGGWFFYFAFFGGTAQALVSSTPCRPGGNPAKVATNVCGGSFTLANKTVKYYFTEHVQSNGRFKIRIDAGQFVNDGREAFFSISASSSPFYTFTTYGLDTDAAFFSQTQVNPAAGAYLRREPAGVTGNIDGVMWVDLNTVAPGAYDFLLSAGFYGAAPLNIPLTFYVDAGAPTNQNETDALAFIGNTNACADYPFEHNDDDTDEGNNDLNVVGGRYVMDCRDAQCNGEVGNPNGSQLCEYGGEFTCDDRFDNDFDADGNGGWEYNRETGADCRDLGCNGLRGDPINPNNKCYYANEAADYPVSCSDNFNNDADNGEGVFQPLATAYDLGNETFYDCRDFDCWGRGGAAGICPLREANCTDGDDDFDEYFQGQVKNIRGVNYFYPHSGNPDSNDGANADCNDYDCGGDPACPGTEDYDRNVQSQSTACFDGKDNDLDNYTWNGTTYNQTPTGKIDCGDPDCAGAINPANPQEVCRPSEFEPWKYQLCWDTLDNDGDDASPGTTDTPPVGTQGGLSCEDNRKSVGVGGDCWQEFGNCGPCPSVENITWDACGNAKDDDLDGALNCSDNDCRASAYTAEVGSVALGALCENAENTDTLCSDGIDNNGSSGADCADSACAGNTGPGFNPSDSVCQSSETNCADGYDNDSDGALDCADTNCQTGGACDLDNWPKSCIQVPQTETIDTTTTLFVEQKKFLHVNDKHEIHVKGTPPAGDDYLSVQILIGDLNNPNLYYPYKASSCTVTGNGAENFDWGAQNGDAGFQVFSSGNVSSFDITISCDTFSAAQDTKTYNVNITVTRVSGNSEIIDKIISTKLFEGTPPNITTIERSGEIAGGETIDIPYGQTLAFRGIPNDPGSGLDSSGICDCLFSFDGSDPSVSGGNDCVQPTETLTADQTLSVNTKAKDGASNVGDPFSRAINVNIVPRLESPLKISKTISDFQTDLALGAGDPLPFDPSLPAFNFAPFYKLNQKMSVNAGFRTASNGAFTSSRCDVRIDGKLVSNLDSDASVAPQGGSNVICSGSFTLNSGLRDDQGQIIPLDEASVHSVSLELVDDDWSGPSDKVNLGISNKQIFYVCNGDPASYSANHVCRRADFDQDGTPDGVAAKASLYSRCVDGSTGVPIEPAEACVSDADCGGGAVCRAAGFCDGSDANNRVMCFSNADCSSGQTCGGLQCDNCPGLYNPNQADLNANGIGDSCDAFGFCSVSGGLCATTSDCPLNSCNGGVCSESGTVCASDSDCALNECVNPNKNEGFCTILCSGGSECNANGYNSNICIANPYTNPNYCAASQVIALCETNTDCNFGAGEICYDNCPNVENPDQKDTDTDGFGNACDCDSDNDNFCDPGKTNADCAGGNACGGVDNCPLVDNPDQADLDGDGIGDACEDDTDGDGIFDDGDGNGTPGNIVCTDGQIAGCDDNCLLVSNSDQSDQNGNGRGDACECDFDGDGVDDPGACGGTDNCPLAPNADQADTDADGIGDACECDFDGDGFCDAGKTSAQCAAGETCSGADNCSYVPNANQSDADGNGTGDACDVIGPEGIYEPYSVSVPRIAQKGLFQNTFTVTMPNVTAPAGTELLCRWHKLNAGNILTQTITLNIPKTFENADIFQYQIQPDENELGDSSLDPWNIVECQATFPSSTPYLMNANKPIYTHGNDWTGFANPDYDGYRASSCYLGTSTTYYGSTDVCSITGDIGSINFLSAGIGIETFCYDGTDNDQKLGADCKGVIDLGVPPDPNCQGLSYACRCTKDDDCPSGAPSCLNGNCVKP